MRYDRAKTECGAAAPPGRQRGGGFVPFRGRTGRRGRGKEALPEQKIATSFHVVKIDAAKSIFTVGPTSKRLQETQCNQQRLFFIGCLRRQYEMASTQCAMTGPKRNAEPPRHRIGNGAALRPFSGKNRKARRGGNEGRNEKTLPKQGLSRQVSGANDGT